MPIGNKLLQTPTNRRRCIAIIIAGIILKALIILAFVLIFMRIRTPKVRLQSVTVENLTSNSTSSPSLSLRLNAQVTVKNPNFGRFKFSGSEISIGYRGNTVGTAMIPGGRGGARSTKKLNVAAAVEADSGKVAYLGGDLNSGRVTLSGEATLNGKVYLFGIIKKKKTATMDCSMDVNTRTRVVENLKCM